tara:strand:+ start:110 stop:352 length:243 start_codon:yes stop_codon:yes gene_type:complete
MPIYNALIQKVPTAEELEKAVKKGAALPETQAVVQGSKLTFKELELALERGLKASVIPRKRKAPAKKAPAKRVAKKKAKK